MKEAKVLDHGFVRLVDMMPHENEIPEGQTADFAIVQAARVSYGQGTKKVSDDENLIRYLFRNRHTSPFEMIEFKFHCSMPMFVARQWIRHRTANVNEYSARYSEVEDKFYIPEEIRAQSKNNKQCSDGTVSDEGAELFKQLMDGCQNQYDIYKKLIDSGVGRELARIGLPVNFYTQWYWKIDLHNLLHFLALRLHKHAQYEIRVYAEAIHEMIKPLVPITLKAFEDYRLNGMFLSNAEIEAIKSGNESHITNRREFGEWTTKKEALGI